MVRPTHEEVACVDDEGALDRFDIDPVTVRCLDLQPARRIILAQDREASVIAVRPLAELAR